MPDPSNERTFAVPTYRATVEVAAPPDAVHDLVADVTRHPDWTDDPIEVEQVLFQHPGVLDAAVVGGPDEKWGERVVAVVVADPAAGAEPAAGDLIAWCRDRLAHFKCPREVHLVAELPRNATGKLLKTELRKRFTGVEGGVVQR